ncbi:HesA/MoeB/ThiF family protein [Anaerocolumna xylanovorans]|uniref:Adenylyltransferase and sulfurtransferase n=1 Tax=Anaerocolumna xylanovorans DSM 12503 TaxID=1121345 RepID=A0A1M7YLT3_9FIRM|nr:HesA/MoeB/ThiF family protein [Anaerocolumna xylanovorans]SHO53552.1 adenylyltransferase and sulfurtransferase [Anaerocolumna xylanovorans DSM 12503]
MQQLSEEQLKRYRRQLILKDIGEEGQKKLLETKVLIIGTGGLGSPVSLYLAAAGIGKLGLVDCDCVDLSNLQRQIIHNIDTVGIPKVDSAKTVLSRLNKDVCVEIYNCLIDEENAESIIRHYDIIVNAVDNSLTRYIVNKVCCKLKRPLVEGAIFNFEGYVTTIIPGETACYECIYEYEENDEKLEIGVIGALPGVIGSLQAMEVIKYSLNIGKLLKNELLYYNALNASFKRVKLERNVECKVCGTVSCKKN